VVIAARAVAPVSFCVGAVQLSVVEKLPTWSTLIEKRGNDADADPSLTDSRMSL
jgi:hypothetical protein